MAVQIKLVSILLDVLKPYEPTIMEFATHLRVLDGVKKIEISLVEKDQKTESVMVGVNGDIDYEALRAQVSLDGAIVQSVDKVIVECSKD